ncbi:ABC transporter permease [Arenimonas caeni]|uniref:Transport permease protein n=1 Tax=Arenimonas caeni TaxID=2058085 RepID=A0A2P6MAD2_9GAMM|nr:ABC transporter permease [Arenimonas caeni]PRH82938.1 sugar ABC transporter permease [Arenimonas caeni]
MAILRSLHRNRELVVALVRREVLGRYRGSVLGLAWSFLHPLFMLAVYTFVFSVVFQARWPGGGGSQVDFALVLFTALLAFGVFAECVGRAPGLVLGNPNYVTKVVFPLEVLPVVSLLSSLFHAAVGLLIWLGFHLLVRGLPSATAVLLPLALAPLLLLTLGVSWFLASLGVFLRDVSQVVGVLTTTLMFLTPIFYAVSSVPPEYQAVMLANPLTPVVEQVRDVMLWGRGLDWPAWGLQMLLSSLLAWAGFAWFQSTRKGFADVL